MATINKIVCPKCQAKLKFDPDKIKSEVVKFNCPGCKSVLRVKNPSAGKDIPFPQTTNFPPPIEDITTQGMESRPLDQAERPDIDVKGLMESAPPTEPEQIEPPAEPTISEKPDWRLKDLPESTPPTELEKTETPATSTLSEKTVIEEKGLTEAVPPAVPHVVEPSAESVIAEKHEEKIHEFHKPEHEEEKGPLISADKLSSTIAPEESLLEDYLHDKLAEFEDGEADAEDFEWTRYADKNEPEIPKTKIDLDLIPVTDSDLHETLADLRQAEVYNLHGETNLGKNLVKQAIRDFNHALEINPDYVDALVNRGSAHVLQNSYNEALADLNHALELENRQAEIYNLRGEIFLLNKLHDEAIKDFTAAIILNPTYSDAYLNRARAYSEKGMPDEAESDYNQAVKAEPDKFSNFIDVDGAESLFDDEELSNKEIEAEHFQQGLENLKSQKYHEAIESFTKAIALSANNAVSHIYRGQAYVELGQPDEAMVDFNRAAIFDPLNPALYYWRAMAWKALDSSINMVADLKLSCELGYEPACVEYETFKPKKH